MTICNKNEKKRKKRKRISNLGDGFVFFVGPPPPPQFLDHEPNNNKGARENVIIPSREKQPLRRAGWLGR